MNAFELTVPMQLPSMANARCHWRKRAAIVAAQRRVMELALQAKVGPTCPLPLPLVVTLTRVSPRELDDDNLRGAFKALRDAIAKWLGVDDKKRKVVRYEYDQRPTPKTHEVRVRIERMPEVV